jgi:hypothetical protein
MVNQPSDIVMKSCQFHERLGPELFVIRITPQRTKELGYLGSTMLIVRVRYRGIARVSVVCSCRIGHELSRLIGLKKWKLFALSLERR